MYVYVCMFLYVIPSEMPVGPITVALVLSRNIRGEADFINALKSRSVTNIQKRAGWWSDIPVNLYSGDSRFESRLVHSLT